MSLYNPLFTFTIKDPKDNKPFVQWKAPYSSITFQDNEDDTEEIVKELSEEYYKLAKDFVSQKLITASNVGPIKKFTTKMLDLFDMQSCHSIYTMFIVDIIDKWSYFVKYDIFNKKDHLLQSIATNLNDYIWTINEEICGFPIFKSRVDIFTTMVKSVCKTSIPPDFDYVCYTDKFANIVKFFISKNILPIPYNENFKEHQMQTHNVVPFGITQTISDDVYVAIKLLSRIIKHISSSTPKHQATIERYSTPPRINTYVTQGPNTPEKPHPKIVIQRTSRGGFV